uniref:Phage protein n=1 Tax=Pseudomonas phage vB_PaeM_HTN4 TaxID=3236645 RepID=A0AB39AHU9_9VIRU
MKYVVMKMTVRGMSREVPVIFPDLISHVNMAASALVALDAECEGFKKAGDKVDITVVSAGFLSSMGIDVHCHGQSDSLNGLKARESVDDELIRMIDYTHGYVG